MATGTTTELDAALGVLVLRILDPHQERKCIRLAAEKCTIGSGPHCTLRLRARGIQPLQCVVHRRPHETTLHSCAPSTRLNGHPFSTAILNVGDRITIGPIELEVAALSHRDGVTTSDLPSSTQPSSFSQNAQYVTKGQASQGVYTIDQIRAASKPNRLSFALLRKTGITQNLIAPSPTSDNIFSEHFDEAWEKTSLLEASSPNDFTGEAVHTPTSSSSGAAEWKRRQEELDARQRDLQEQINRWESERLQSVQRSTAWREELAQQSAALRTRQAALDVREEEVAAIEAKYTARQASFDTLESELNARKSELDAVQKQLASLQRERDSLQEAYRKETEAHTADLEKSRSSYTAESEYIEVEKSRIKAMQQAMLAEKNGFETQQQVFQTAQKIFDEKKNEFHETKKAFELEKAALQESKNVLEIEKAALLEDKNALEIEKNHYIENKKALKDEKRSLEEIKRFLDLDRQSLVEQQEAFQSAQLAFETGKQAFQSQRLAFDAEKEAYHAEQAAAGKPAAVLKEQQTAEALSTSDENTEEVDLLRRRVSELEEQLTEVESLRDQLDARACEWKEQRRAMETDRVALDDQARRISDREVEVRNLSNSLESQRIDIEVRLSELRDKEEEVQKLVARQEEQARAIQAREEEYSQRCDQWTSQHSAAALTMPANASSSAVAEENETSPENSDPVDSAFAPSSPVEESRKEPEDIKDILRRLGHRIDDEDIEEEPQAESTAENKPSACEYRTPSLTAAAPVHPHHADDETSIDDYMAQLMKRVRGEQGKVSNPSSTPSSASESTSMRKESGSDAMESPLMPAPGGKTSGEPMKMEPRAAAPEKKVNISALRDLANLSAHNAISKYSRRKTSDIAFSKLMVSLVALVVGIALLWYWMTFSAAKDLTLYSSGLAFFTSFLWAVKYVIVKTKSLFRSGDGPRISPTREQAISTPDADNNFDPFRKKAERNDGDMEGEDDLTPGVLLNNVETLVPADHPLAGDEMLLERLATMAQDSVAKKQ